jgi:hypothetical protein
LLKDLSFLFVQLSRSLFMRTPSLSAVPPGFLLESNLIEVVQVQKKETVDYIRWNLWSGNSPLTIV